ncbi:MAG: class F sortase, partial [Actinomycetota bacterium]|nr:class F sortase [Actinomycetota bacterium]
TPAWSELGTTSRLSGWPAASAASAAAGKPGRPGRPVRVLVDGLGVDAPVVPIRAARGVLTPPADPSTAGWWRGGAVPGGQRGSVVITGHTVHGGVGAFDELGSLEPGDLVAVGTGRRLVRYRVTSTDVWSRWALAKRSARLFDPVGPARLVLVTCDDWDGTAYRSNAVVTARPT